MGRRTPIAALVWSAHSRRADLIRWRWKPWLRNPARQLVMLDKRNRHVMGSLCQNHLVKHGRVRVSLKQVRMLPGNMLI